MNKLCKNDTCHNLLYITQDNLQTFMRGMFLKLKVKSDESKQHAHMHVCTHTQSLKIKRQIESGH